MVLLKMTVSRFPLVALFSAHLPVSSSIASVALNNSVNALMHILLRASPATYRRGRTELDKRPLTKAPPGIGERLRHGTGQAADNNGTRPPIWGEIVGRAFCAPSISVHDGKMRAARISNCAAVGLRAESP